MIDLFMDLPMWVRSVLSLVVYGGIILGSPFLALWLAKGDMQQPTGSAEKK